MVTGMTNLNLFCGTKTDCGESDVLLTYEPLDSASYGAGCVVTGLADADGAPVSITVPSRSPDGRAVVAIADGAFEGCGFLRSVSLPDGVVSVGRRSFAFCSSLSELRIGKNSRLSHIGSRAFMGCDRLESLRLDGLAGLRAVGEKAFAYCAGLRSVSLPDSLTDIPGGLFEGCRRLHRVRFPKHLIRIGCSAFYACVGLETVHMPSDLRIIEDAAFACCASLRELHLPAAPCMVAGTAFDECPLLPALPELLGAG